ncbi:hypothetical protein CTA1_2821 [Colletotrichum tanaceti]|uniref:Uncharacterized protein n=1 Tax=Colletotrichum tanaceti TaxID=1306861 RepID=A0A4U6XCY9_9PEZI|nr:hypothetical protein CTA1_2821 [Colletotrichum tanaceti]
MKGRLGILPGLQTAAALYLARAAEAKVFCADSGRNVVPEANCQGVETPGQFFVFGKDVASMAPNARVEPDIDIYDASDVIMRQNARFPPPRSPPTTPQNTGRLEVRHTYNCDTDDDDGDDDDGTRGRDRSKNILLPGGGAGPGAVPVVGLFGRHRHNSLGGGGGSRSAGGRGSSGG